MQKIISVGLVAVTALSLANVPVGIPTAHAASWHKGTPKVLRGKWRGTKKTIKRTKYIGHAGLVIKAKSIMNTDALPPKGPDYSSKLHYKKTGRHTYTVVGRSYTNAPANGVKITFKFKVYNHHKIHFHEVHGRSDGNGIFYRR